jgi:hypothetical protein
VLVRTVVVIADKLEDRRKLVDKSSAHVESPGRSRGPRTTHQGGTVRSTVGRLHKGQPHGSQFRLQVQVTGRCVQQRSRMSTL